MKSKTNNYDRRKFFNNIVKSAAGITIMSVFPLKLLFNKSERKQLKKVKLHPSSVKRNNKGFRNA